MPRMIDALLQLAWKPHDKSMSLGQLALHMARCPGNVAEVSQQSPFEAPEFTHPAAASAAELVPALQQSVARALRRGPQLQ